MFKIDQRIGNVQRIPKTSDSIFGGGGQNQRYFFFKINTFSLPHYFDPMHLFFIVKINIFRGDLSDILAKTATLGRTGAEGALSTLTALHLPEMMM